MAASAFLAFAAPLSSFADTGPSKIYDGTSASLHDAGARTTANSAGTGGLWGEAPQSASFSSGGRHEASFDLGTLLGWSGVTLHISSHSVKARDLGSGYASRVIASGGVPSTRRTTVWLEQHLFGDKVSIRAGQLAADEDFFIGPSGLAFVNTTFGLPAAMAANLPSTGPLYALMAPGVRLRANVSGGFSFLSAVFRGDPAAKPSLIDPLLRSPGSPLFATDGGTFVISEAQYATALGDQDLPGTYKFGAWYHTGTFGDMHYDNLGGSLASATTSGVPRQHEGNFGVYGIASQTIWQPRGKRGRGLKLFLKVGGAPSDRNPIDFFIDGGAGYQGVLASRGDDYLGVAVAYARISDSVRQLNQDALALDGISGTTRSHDAVVELTYQAQIAPGWRVQPGVQYVFSPGSDVADASDPSATLPKPNALIVGVRTTLADW